MDIRFTPEATAFRTEVRQFLDENLDDELRRATRLTTGVHTRIEACQRWSKILAARGWVAPGWPVEYGGCGWDHLQLYIYGVECFRAGAPLLFNMGVRHIGPVLMAHGTPEQRDFYIPRILSAEDIWCQGYSEPGAGSDLAALQLQAVREDDHYVLNGSKMWTTGAHFSSRMFCLVRTSNAGPKQHGISFLLIDMQTPGLDVRPIITMAGDHETNQVFFNDVRVPVANRVGEEHDGWQVAKVLMQYARTTNVNMAWVREAMRRLKEIALSEPGSGCPRLWDDPGFRRRMTQVEIALQTVEVLELRVMSEEYQDRHPGALSSMLKTRGSEVKQQVTELAAQAVGYYGLPFQPRALDPYQEEDFVGPAYALTPMPTYLNERAATIYSGSSEIQRDVLAKRVLGLR